MDNILDKKLNKLTLDQVIEDINTAPGDIAKQISAQEVAKLLEKAILIYIHSNRHTIYKDINFTFGPQITIFNTLYGVDCNLYDTDIEAEYDTIYKFMNGLLYSDVMYCDSPEQAEGHDKLGMTYDWDKNTTFCNFISMVIHNTNISLRNSNLILEAPKGIGRLLLRIKQRDHQ